MTRILLIRHGNTDLHNRKLCGRLQGISLNEAGIRQSRQLAKFLCTRHRIAAIYSSPLERTVETARIIAEAQTPALEVTLDERLNEIDLGDWTGRSFESLHAVPDWRQYNINRSLHRPPDGESFLDVQSRAWKSLVDIIAGGNESRTVAVVTHSDVIRALLVLFLGMPLDLLLRIEIDPASVSQVIFDGAYPVVSTMNMVQQL